MALWKPYADDVPLDLSRPAAPETPLPCPAECSGYTPQLPVPMAYQQVMAYQQIELGLPISPGRSSGYDSISPNELRHFVNSPLRMSAEIHKGTLPYHSVDVDTLSHNPAFQEFERSALQTMAEKNGGALLGNNPRMRRTVRATHAGARRQRERNNAAAKQSRDRRKRREIDLSLKVSFLKKQYAALRAVARTTVCNRCHQSCLC